MDKLFVVIVLALIWFEARERLVVLIVAVRELALIPVAVAYLARRRPVGELHADAIGKATTVAQLVTLAAVFGAPAWALPAAVVTAALGLAAAVHYALSR